MEVLKNETAQKEVQGIFVELQQKDAVLATLRECLSQEKDARTQTIIALHNYVSSLQVINLSLTETENAGSVE